MVFIVALSEINKFGERNKVVGSGGKETKRTNKKESLKLASEQTKAKSGFRLFGESFANFQLRKNFIKFNLLFMLT